MCPSSVAGPGHRGGVLGRLGEGSPLGAADHVLLVSLHGCDGPPAHATCTLEGVSLNTGRPITTVELPAGRIQVSGDAVRWAAPSAVTAATAGSAAARAGTWRTAIEVPGLGSLNKGGNAQLASVSCGSAGNCAAGGFYLDGSGHFQAFVVSERNGLWGKAIEVPGSGALNADGFAIVRSLSCASAGNCAAGGFYADGSGHGQAFVASETNGSWGRAKQVPGLGTLNKGGDASATSVSCRSARNCAAGGTYTDASGHFQAFVVSQSSGRLARAHRVQCAARQMRQPAGNQARVRHLQSEAACPLDPPLADT